MFGASQRELPGDCPRQGKAMGESHQARCDGPMAGRPRSSRSLVRQACRRHGRRLRAQSYRSDTRFHSRTRISGRSDHRTAWHPARGEVDPRRSDGGVSRGGHSPIEADQPRRSRIHCRTLGFDGRRAHLAILARSLGLIWISGWAFTRQTTNEVGRLVERFPCQSLAVPKIRSQNIEVTPKLALSSIWWCTAWRRLSV